MGACRPQGGGGLDASRAVCDTLEETVKELREQLRKREQLEAELEASRNQVNRQNQLNYTVTFSSSRIF